MSAVHFKIYTNAIHELNIKLQLCYTGKCNILNYSYNMIWMAKNLHATLAHQMMQLGCLHTDLKESLLKVYLKKKKKFTWEKF